MEQIRLLATITTAAAMEPWGPEATLVIQANGGSMVVLLAMAVPMAESMAGIRARVLVPPIPAAAQEAMAILLSAIPAAVPPIPAAAQEAMAILRETPQIILLQAQRAAAQVARRLFPHVLLVRQFAARGIRGVVSTIL